MERFRVCPILVLAFGPAIAVAADNAPAREKALDAVNFNPIYGSVVPGSQAGEYRPLTSSQRRRLYVASSLRNYAIPVRALLPPIADHLGNDPEHWGQGWAAFGKRAGNRAGRFSIQDGLEAGTSAALGFEPRYVFCTCKGFLRRSRHALLMTVITLDSKGRRAPHIPRLGAAFASEFIGNQWLPAADRKAGEAVQGVVLQVGLASAFNLVKEFSPEWTRYWKRLRHK